MVSPVVLLLLLLFLLPRFILCPFLVSFRAGTATGMPLAMLSVTILAVFTPTSAP